VSGPLIVPIMKFVATAYSAKTAVEGIKERNFGKAILGGVGAYMGLNSLAAGTAAAGEQVAGQAVASNVGSEAAMDSMSNALAPSVAPAVEAGAVDVATNSVGSGIVDSGMQNLFSSPPPIVSTPVQAAGEGIISSVAGWTKENPMLAYGGMQLAGSALAGSAQEDLQNERLEEQRRLEEESRKRRSYWAPSDLAGKKYNPRTGQFEPE